MNLIVTQITPLIDRIKKVEEITFQMSFSKLKLDCTIHVPAGSDSLENIAVFGIPDRLLLKSPFHIIKIPFIDTSATVITVQR